ncbi:unnamed protein product [Paramecium octaurelia]|uniref:Uncharacterized protein n=1 Tax=Paramecium octaurelia TaxID=43137 RepID=A0A8S1YE25_PAROT|nr:unnamed protein product [Paramecium octaurelia]
MLFIQIIQFKDGESKESLFLKGILECCQERKQDRSYEYEGGEDFKYQNLTEEQIRIQQKNFTEALDTADYVIVKQSIISSDSEQGKSKKQSRGSWSQNKAGQFVKTDQDVVNNQDKHFNQMKIYVIDLNEGGKLTISEQTIPQDFRDLSRSLVMKPISNSILNYSEAPKTFKQCAKSIREITSQRAEICSRLRINKQYCR